MSTYSAFIRLGAICAFLAVALGAFGAHGLKSVVTPEMLEVYKTGVTYHMWHALALLVIGLLCQQSGNTPWLLRAGWLMLVGILLFSGSLYLLVLLQLKWLGMITPFGGLCLLAGWFCLLMAGRSNPENPQP